jgi:uncharacterized protein (DUF2235 family)
MENIKERIVMENICNASSTHGLRIEAFAIVLTALIIIFLPGCASTAGNDNTSSEFFTEVSPFSGNPTENKNIFVFLDGTANNPASGTNVWRLYQLVLQNNDPQMVALYAEGVGSAHDAPLTGAVLGRGMEDRILEGYEFIWRHFSPGDQVYIFGFSRGAHQARALAGLISYAGVPRVQGDGFMQRRQTANRIIELTKKQSDDAYLEAWRSWQPGQPALLTMDINESLGIDVQPIAVNFLGIWDTVPGSSLKNYGYCKENKGFVKNDLSVLVPGVDKGERYKTDSYPSIRNIAHAVSLDEKRSKFAPLLVCQAINATYSNISEVWFPGAHADVGGGYTDSNELAGISLGWMVDLLNKTYPFEPYPEVHGSATGLAHWSIGDSPANKFSRCEDRQPPADAHIHDSFDERKAASPVPLCWKGVPKPMAYPVNCPEK